MLYTANTTVEACAEWVTGTWRVYPLYTSVRWEGTVPWPRLRS